MQLEGKILVFKIAAADYTRHVLVDPWPTTYQVKKIHADFRRSVHRFIKKKEASDPTKSYAGCFHEASVEAYDRILRRVLDRHYWGRYAFINQHIKELKYEE